MEVIGHFMTPYPTVNSFFQRQNILFVGAIYELDSPNADSVIWLCQEIFPQIQSYLGQEVKLLIAGNNEVEGLNLSVSVTTRQKRKDEIEGKHYFFKNEKEFNKLVKQNEFIEHANVFGFFYGTASTK